MIRWSCGGVTVNSDGGLVTLAQPWTAGVRTRIRPERFDHITTGGTHR